MPLLRKQNDGRTFEQNILRLLLEDVPDTVLPEPPREEKKD